ncbi:MAG: sugar phosphate isomerase/epimerase [Clostridia bacterium]|nr:sugar phosphate isomerase/epimerase [Clostridia bacterium]
MRTIGINLHAAKGLTDEEYLREIASLGFGAIFSGVLPPERQTAVADLCARYGIIYETLHAPFGHINDIWLADDNGMLDELRHCIDHCILAGAPIAVVHLSAGMNPPSITDIGRERFARLVDYAAEKNIIVAFENQRKLANIAWAFEAFTTDTVRFCWDCGHEFCFTPGRHYMPLFGDRLVCTHIHDNTAVFNDDSHFLPFDGACDFDYVAKTLRESGYGGSLMLEVGNPSRYGDLEPREFLQKAADAAKILRRMIDREEDNV